MNVFLDLFIRESALNVEITKRGNELIILVPFLIKVLNGSTSRYELTIAVSPANPINPSTKLPTNKPKRVKKIRPNGAKTLGGNVN